MELGRFEFCLNVKDLKGAVSFYKKLGFRVIGGKAAEGWQIVQSGKTRLGLFHGHIRENVLNFRGGHAANLASRIQRKGIGLGNVHVKPGSRVGSFTVKDPDGNVLFFDTAPGETPTHTPKVG